MNQCNQLTESQAKSSGRTLLVGRLVDGRSQPHSRALTRQPEHAAHVFVASAGEQLSSGKRIAQVAWTHAGRGKSNGLERLPHNDAEHHVVDGSLSARGRKQEIALIAGPLAYPLHQCRKSKFWERNLAGVTRATLRYEGVWPGWGSVELAEQRTTDFSGCYPRSWQKGNDCPHPFRAHIVIRPGRNERLQSLIALRIKKESGRPIDWPRLGTGEVCGRTNLSQTDLDQMAAQAVDKLCMSQSRRCAGRAVTVDLAEEEFKVSRVESGHADVVNKEMSKKSFEHRDMLPD